ncbi:MAG: acyl-CoA thioesterase [Pseudomonadota bacterium]|nr:acyl-CoA thioesterase [Pseudomonadota bacterium]
MGEGQTTREPPPHRGLFAVFAPMTTRWKDNDPYGHLNNVIYYELFDAAVNALLIERGLLDPATSPVIGLVVDSRCRFFASLAFPDRIEVGVCVEAIGRSSVNYRLAVFKEGAATAAADGRYTHVYVERASGRPVAIPEPHRRAMAEWKLSPTP